MGREGAIGDTTNNSVWLAFLKTLLQTCSNKSGSYILICPFAPVKSSLEASSLSLSLSWYYFTSLSKWNTQAEIVQLVVYCTVFQHFIKVVVSFPVQVCWAQAQPFIWPNDPQSRFTIHLLVAIWILDWKLESHSWPPRHLASWPRAAGGPGCSDQP